MRLDKFLSNAGIGSRKFVKKIIKEGRVKIGTQVIKDPAYEVKNERVFFDNEEVEPYHNVYIALYKPSGYTSSKSEYERNIFEFIDHPYVDKLHIAGRLDKDVEGLLIITNDGEFTHKVISPRKKIEKEYLVEVDGKLTREMIEMAERGIVLNNGTKFASAKVTEIREGLISIVITEGKYHEIKLITKIMGLRYKRIKRIRIGKLKLEDLKLSPGEWKELPKEKVSLILGE
ncbi:MAG: rRNA pseudouridine synthase [Thermosipho sp. (in: Bacteria)]|nr:rRNA pseudouridine synthase [Thermosipho sp. (in: thermotogales)]